MLMVPNSSLTIGVVRSVRARALLAVRRGTMRPVARLDDGRERPLRLVGRGGIGTLGLDPSTADDQADGTTGGVETKRKDSDACSTPESDSTEGLLLFGGVPCPPTGSKKLEPRGLTTPDWTWAVRSRPPEDGVGD